MIAKRSRHDRAAEVPPPPGQAEIEVNDGQQQPNDAAGQPPFVQALRRRYPYHLRRRNIPVSSFH